MVHREEPDGLIVISQPAHSWVSGQLARHWGNPAFGGIAPGAEVCLAAEQHDIGFLDWEQAPTLDRQTGRPHQFMNMPTRPHLKLWAASVMKLMAYNRYAALLVSLHVTHLCRNNKVTRNPRDAQALQDYLDQQQALQSELIAKLQDDPLYAKHLTPAKLETNTKLIAAWDWMSLVFCIGKCEQQQVSCVPAATGLTSLALIPMQNDSSTWQVDPWPFSGDEVRLVFDGRRLPLTFNTQTDMRNRMRETPTVTLRLRLCPG